MNRDAKGNNEKPAARSKADAAEPLGISLYLSRGGNGFFVALLSVSSVLTAVLSVILNIVVFTLSAKQ